MYLYIINYARVKLLETLLSVNTLKCDALDFNGNPVIRAIAVRIIWDIDFHYFIYYVIKFD